MALIAALTAATMTAAMTAILTTITTAVPAAVPTATAAPSMTAAVAVARRTLRDAAAWTVLASAPRRPVVLRGRNRLRSQTRRWARGRLRNFACRGRRHVLHRMRTANGRHAGDFRQRLCRLCDVRIRTRRRSTRATAPVAARVRGERAAASLSRRGRRVPRQELLPGQMLPPATRTFSASIPQEIHAGVVAHGHFDVSSRQTRIVTELLELNGDAA